jgi:hypothetical protein
MKNHFGNNITGRLSIEELSKQVQDQLDRLTIDRETQMQYLKEQSSRRKNEYFKRPINKKEKEQLTTELILKLGELEEREEEAKAIASEFREMIKKLKTLVSETKQIIKDEARSVNDMVYIVPDFYNRVVVLVDPETMKVVDGRDALDTDLQKQILD